MLKSFFSALQGVKWHYKIKAHRKNQKNGVLRAYIRVCEMLLLKYEKLFTFSLLVTHFSSTKK